VNAEIINLRRVKKALTRGEKEKKAETNRQKFGRNKVEKSLSKFESARDAHKLEGKKLTD
jgi:Domain of unknown function (DUF4169)